MAGQSDVITVREFYEGLQEQTTERVEMERRILQAIKKCAVENAGLAEKVEANRANIVKIGTFNGVLTAIGSTIAAAIGINNN